MSKFTQDFHEEDWKQIIREGNWYTDFEQVQLKEYLKAESVCDVSYSDYACSVAASLIYRFRIEDFLKHKGLTIEKVVVHGHDGEYAPSYSNIEYELGKFKSCVSCASLLISGPLGKFFFSLEPRHDSYSFKVATLKAQTYGASQFMAELQTYSESHNFLIGKKISPSCDFIKVDDKLSWDDLILSPKLADDIRRNLKNLIEHREVYHKNNLTLKRGLIFSGPPGCGKSTLGKILCKTIDWTFLWVTPKHLVHPKNISAILDLAVQLAPTIIFLEDIDLYGGSRESSANPTLLGELMNQLDGIQEMKDIITIATTNAPEVLEKALIDRPGRFDKVLTFELPGDEERVRMLKHFARNIRLGDDVKFEGLAKLTKDMAGAHLRELINLSVLHAIDAGSFDENKIITLNKVHIGHALAAVKRKDFSKVGFGVGSSGASSALVPDDCDWEDYLDD